VLEAEGQHLSYGLRLPGTRIAPSRGATHQHACLKALALYDCAAAASARRAA
jgi:uncharacterized protein (DUF58 family)